MGKSARGVFYVSMRLLAYKLWKKKTRINNQIVHPAALIFRPLINEEESVRKVKIKQTDFYMIVRVLHLKHLYNPGYAK